ncbi:hypothetical protein [Parerythrobacter lacustris]|uniref:Uncharacterized protein n=1 Tax=Parerythrobacter lacustris TaxID=2969984 RepID=A0ABT1XUA1_9SPHN|nr:hypothetical protein [Parerythrobacter lacustris]MCR2834802.1 hypothetical protein [Parerythrobacter lacustris]
MLNPQTPVGREERGVEANTQKLIETLEICLQCADGLDLGVAGIHISHAIELIREQCEFADEGIDN